MYVSLKKKTDQVDKNEGVYTFWKQLLQSKPCTIIVQGLLCLLYFKAYFTIIVGLI